MDALFVLSAILITLVLIAMTGIAFGADSRDGFGEDRLRQTIR